MSDDDEVRRLKLQEHDGIAVQAAFEHFVRRSFEDASGAKKVSHVRSLESYLEGRLRMSVPIWWGPILQRIARRQGSMELILSCPDEIDPYQEADGRYFVPKAIAVSHTDDSLIVKSGNCDVILSRKTVKTTEARCFNVCCDGEFAYVVFHHGAGSNAILTKVARSNGNELWKETVQAGHFPGARTGSGFHFVEVQSKLNRCFVFGIHEEAAYIECFDAGNGRCHWRASTSYVEAR